MPSSFLEKTISFKNSELFRDLFITGKTISMDEFLQSKEYKGFGLSLLIGIPFFSKQKVIGGLFLCSKEKKTVDKKDLAFLEAIGREMGTAIAKMHVEEELISSQKNLQTIFDAIDDFFIVFDSETGQIINANKKVQNTLNLTLKTLTKRKIYDLIAEKDKETMKRVIEEVKTDKRKEAVISLQKSSKNLLSEKFTFLLAQFTDRTVIVARFYSPNQ